MISNIQVTNLSKTYGQTRALDRITFTVSSGSIYGMIGPNGAGKTTALSILAGLMRPTSGMARILDINVQPNQRQLASRIGFYSPAFGFFDYLKGREILLACGLMHGLTPEDTENRAQDLLQMFDLESAAGHFVYEYSHGMRQKLGLACAFIHAPEVLLLDEPFTGLDATSVYRLIYTLRQMASHGRTILLTSHDLALVDRVCDRVGILHEGELKYERELPASIDGHTTAEPKRAERESSLESLLWEVVGTPQTKELAWI